MMHARLECTTTQFRTGKNSSEFSRFFVTNIKRINRRVLIFKHCFMNKKQNFNGAIINNLQCFSVGVFVV